MTTYHLMIHEDLRQQINQLSAEYKRDPSSDAGQEYVAVINGLKALQQGQETTYQGKQLGYGPHSHDLRDCAELKVPVFDERPMGPSHRLTYREFEPLPKVEGNRVVADPDAKPYRQAVAFAHRSADPAAITGDRLGRERGRPARDLQGLAGGGRPQTGPQRPGVQTTPHRLPVPADLLKQAQILRDSPPAGTAPRPAVAPQANVNRPAGPGAAQSKER